MEKAVSLPRLCLGVVKRVLGYSQLAWLKRCAMRGLLRAAAIACGLENSHVRFLVDGKPKASALMARRALYSSLRHVARLDLVMHELHHGVMALA